MVRDDACNARLKQLQDGRTQENAKKEGKKEKKKGSRRCGGSRRVETLNVRMYVLCCMYVLCDNW